MGGGAGEGIVLIDSVQMDSILALPKLGAVMRANEQRASLTAAPAWREEIWRWVIWLSASRGLATATRASYAATLGGFADWCARKGLDYADLSLNDIDEWQRDLMYQRRIVAGSRAYALAALRNFYDWRSTRGLGRNCVDGVRSPKIPKRKPRKYTKRQLQQLFAATRRGITSLVCRRDEALLLMLWATGMRCEEAATLRIDQLELDERVGVVRIDGKGGKEREVAFEGPAVRILREWLVVRDQLSNVLTDTVFLTVRKNWFGRQMQPHTIECVVKAIAKRAGLGEWGVHRFRVTFATQLYDDGVDIEKIRILLGHEDINTTRKYIAVSDRQRRFRLKAFRQHEVLGTAPDGLPRWAKNTTNTRGK